MMAFWEVLLLVLQGLAILTLAPIAILGLYEYIMVDQATDKFLKKLHIPLNKYQIIYIGIGATMMFFISQISLQTFFTNGDIIDRIKMILNRE